MDLGTIFLYLWVLVLLGLGACNQEAGTYNIHGTLLKDWQLEPVPNQVLGLYYVTDFAADELLKTTTTSSDGGFRFEYEEIASGGELGVKLDNGTEIYRNIPINENIVQTVFVDNFLKFNIRVENIQAFHIDDTLFYSYGLDNLQGETMKIPSWSGNNSLRDTVLAGYVVLSQTGNLNLGERIFGTGAIYESWTPTTGEQYNSGFAWGLGQIDFLKSYHSGGYRNGVKLEDYYHRIQVPVYPFPEVNEVTIVVE